MTVRIAKDLLSSIVTFDKQYRFDVETPGTFVYLQFILYLFFLAFPASSSLSLTGGMTVSRPNFFS